MLLKSDLQTFAWVTNIQNVCHPYYINMKYSKYNYIIHLSNSKLLFNTASDGLIVISPELYSILQNTENPDSIGKIHPTFYKSLVDKKFIVENDKDEYQAVLEAIKKETDSKCYHITVNPTLACNFRCWYCYQSHIAQSYMNDSILSATLLFIRNVLKDDATERIVLSFFGGEPLLYYNRIVRPIIESSLSYSEEIGKRIDYYMTTNGYLLSQKVVDDLARQNVTVDFQIPIDGDEDTHNKTKFLTNGKGTYDVIKANIFNAVEKGFPVTIRCNYTKDNIKSFKRVADDFKSLSNRENLELHFHKIWQERENAELSALFQNVIEYVRCTGFKVIDNSGQKGLCYADKERSITINYDGSLYKCTARDFKDSNRVGFLNESGVPVYNSNYDKRKNCKYKSTLCRECIIFPICMQTCSQNVLESANSNECVGDNSDSNIKKTILSRINNLT